MGLSLKGPFLRQGYAPGARAVPLQLFSTAHSEFVDMGWSQMSLATHSDNDPLHLEIEGS